MPKTNPKTPPKTPEQVARTPSAAVILSQVKVLLPTGRVLFAIRDFQFHCGARVLIQGPSGCGKTSLLHLIAGLFLPSEGDVFLNERRLSAMTDDERCDLRREELGVIFQKLNILEHLTVKENIALVSHSPGRMETTSDAEAEILSALDKVNLQGRGSERCSHLSLGEQQRVAVARVLAQKPRILLADEPTSSLDEKNADFIMQGIFQAARETLIVVSHDQRIAKHFDRVIQFREMIQ